MPPPAQDRCPLCSLEIQEPPRPYPNRDAVIYTCTRCGTYGLTGPMQVVMTGGAGPDTTQRALLSYLVRRMQRNEPPILSTDSVQRLLEENELPSPFEQIQNLVLWLGKRLTAPGERVSMASQEQRAIVGAGTDENFFWVLKTALDRGIIEGTLHSGGVSGTLSFDGWQLYEELTAQRVDNRTAFMAMPFGVRELDNMFSNCFRSAVARAGFSLIRLDERAPAGSIDDRLRVEIRRARFLVAELTGGNHGVYWESGFAEGLGKPVIYTCQDSYFNDPGTHFDTSHMHTVLWNANAVDDAAQRLTATIRATLPEDAVLSD